MKKFLCLLAVLLIGTMFNLRQARAQDFSIEWHTIDGGGGATSGESFHLNGTIGQHDASQTATGGQFSLTGGFWAMPIPDFVLGDLNGDGVVDLLDVAPFVQAIADGVFIPEADINEDGDVNLLDVDPFIVLLTG